MSEKFSIIAATQPELVSYTQKFQNDWIKGTCPQVTSVFVVKNSKLLKRWQEYKSKLGIHQKVEELYHGTKLMCSITGKVCQSEECGICGISIEGFDRRCIRKNITFQRFGHGFYLAPHSSKCHDYTQGKDGYRAMILFAVLPGKKHTITRTDEKLTLPPGFDSVYGQPGESLNYPELVLYHPDAALPKCIIMYQKGGNDRIAK